MKKNIIIRIIVTIIYTLLIFFLNAILKDMFSKDSAKEVFGIISDGFTIAGLLYICAGALTWANFKGFFDAIGYGFKSLKYLFSPSKRALEGKVSYYDFIKNKEDNGRKWYPFLIYYGLIILGIGVLTFIVYYVL